MFRKVIISDVDHDRDFSGKGYSRIFINTKDKGKESKILKLLEDFDKDEFSFYYGLEGKNRKNYVTIWDESDPKIELYYTHKFSIDKVNDFVSKCKEELDADILVKFSLRNRDDEHGTKYV